MRQSKKNTVKTIYAHEALFHATKKSLFKSPPKNIKFVYPSFKPKSTKSSLSIVSNTSIRKIVKNILKKLRDFLQLPRIKLFLPSNSRNYNYILSNYCLVLSIKKGIYGPLEHIGDVIGYKYHKLKSPLFLALLKAFILSNRCKYLFL